MALSEQDKVDTLKELFDTQRVNLYCGLHNYHGPVKGAAEVMPTMGCPSCIKVFLIHELATTPPSERRQKLDEIEEVLNHCAELDDKGEFDFVPYEHAQIEIGQA
jgi:hypothetical protein